MGFFDHTFNILLTVGRFSLDNKDRTFVKSKWWTTVYHQSCQIFPTVCIIFGRVSMVRWKEMWFRRKNVGEKYYRDEYFLYLWHIVVVDFRRMIRRSYTPLDFFVVIKCSFKKSLYDYMWYQWMPSLFICSSDPLLFIVFEKHGHHVTILVVFNVLVANKYL